MKKPSFDGVIIGIFAATIVALLIFTGMRLDRLDRKLDSAVTGMHQNHVELVKAISGLSQDLRRKKVDE